MYPQRNLWRRNLEYYLGITLYRELIPEPKWYLVHRIKELPNCMSQETTRKKRC